MVHEENLPILPEKLSIARKLIDAWLEDSNNEDKNSKSGINSKNDEENFGMQTTSR